VLVCNANVSGLRQLSIDTVLLPTTVHLPALHAPDPYCCSGREDWAEESRSFAVALAKVADATKALDISVLHVAPLVSWTSYMVICTVQSRPQLLAVLARMEDTAAGDWERSKQNSELGSSQWEVLDFGDVVAHVFTQVSWAAARVTT